MNNSREISVRIVVNDDGTVAVKKFGDEAERGMKKAEQSSKGLSGTLQTLKSNWLAATAAITGAVIALQKAWNMAEAAVQFEQSRQAFASMATSMGADAEKLYTTLREKSAGLIDEKSLTESANRAMSLGIPVEKLGELMDIARAKARDMGISTTQAFNDIATGIGRGSPMILDNLGLIMKVGAANEAMAAKLKKSVDELTDKEKKMALLNATIEAGSEALERHDLALLTNNEKMQKLKATVTDLQLVMGQGLIRAFAGAYGAMQWLAAGALTIYAGFTKVMEGYHKLRALMSSGYSGKYHTAMADDYAADAKAANEAAQELTGKAVDNFRIMTASVEDLAGAQQTVSAAVKNAAEDAAAAAEKQRTAMVKASEEAIAIAEEDKKALEGRLGDAERYYTSLQNMIAANAEEEKRTIAEISRLKQMQVSAEQSAAGMIARIRGEEQNSKENYEKRRTDLTMQYISAMRQEGEARYKALEEYKQAVSELQQQYSQGVMGPQNMFGTAQEVISAKQVAIDAIADIERATQVQISTAGQLADTQQDNLSSIQAWGQAFQNEATAVQGEIERIKGLISEISTAIAALQTTIALTGEDRVTDVVREIERSIERLHEYAKTPILITTIHRQIMAGGAPAEAVPAEAVPAYATGTDYVPRTGLYLLHKGEEVRSVGESRKADRPAVNISGDIVINVPTSAAADRPEDWRMITRNYIVPELRALGAR